MTTSAFANGSHVGTGRPVLVLHGGGGPFTTALLVQHLAETNEVFAPTHPGFNGTPREDDITSVRSLADAYADYLIENDLRDVVVVGSSVGGWIAAELALGRAADRLAGLVPINAAGFEVAGNSVRDLAGLTPQQIAQFSFHDPSKLQVPPPSPEGLSIAQGNAAALAAYSANPNPVSDFGAISTPTLILWGASDKVVDLAYGRAMADAIPGSSFVEIPDAGHLPYFENAPAVFAALDPFVASVAG